MSINPETLRKFRKASRLSQDALAGESKVGKRTIARIESGEIDPEKVRNSTVEKLSTALKCDPGDLENELDEEMEAKRKLRKLGFVPLQGYISGEAGLDYGLVERRYGVSARAIMETAPLAFLLLAEGSLVWRKKKVEAFDEAADNLFSMAGGHFDFVNAIDRAVDASVEEKESIAKRDLFGRSVAEDTYSFGYDPSTNNPFADYLRELASTIDDDVLEFDPDGIGLWRVGQEVPEYTIDCAYLSELADGDYRAEYALKHRHVRIKDIPENLLGSEARDARVAWLTQHIPAEMCELLDSLLDIKIEIEGI